MKAGECSVHDCGRSILARGWCNMHYSRWLRLGSLALPSCASGRSQKSVADEFGISQQSVSLIVRGEHWTQASAS